MNLFFVLWLWLFCPRRVWVMFHEIAYPLDSWRSVREKIIAIVQRIMAAMVIQSADQIFVSIPLWTPLLRRLGGSSRTFEWLPIPSTLSETPSPERVLKIRQELLSDSRSWLVGHFGTYGSTITPLLRPVIENLLEDRRVGVLLLGRGSAVFVSDLLRDHPEWSDRLWSRDSLAMTEVGEHLAACDLLFQPYPDGASTRRTSLMAGLFLKVPVVSNLGALSESLWSETDAIALSPPDSNSTTNRIFDLLADPEARSAYAASGNRLYHSRFTWSEILRKLLGRVDSSDRA